MMPLKEKIALLKMFTEDEILDLNENNLLKRSGLICALIDAVSKYIERINEN